MGTNATKEKQVARARRESTMERWVWAIFFVVLIGGGGLWSARSWMRSGRSQETNQLLLPIFATSTPSPIANDGDDVINLGVITATVQTTGTMPPASTLPPVSTPSVEADPASSPATPSNR